MNVQLNEKQQEGYEKFINGNNLFITGSGGAGKTVLINKIVNHCIINGNEVGVTSSTGISATYINGTTIHSFLKLGIGKKNVYKIYAGVRENYIRYVKLLKLKVLIIDEISMINKVLFNKINRLLQLIKRNNKPFGGIQTILSGDFCQLKPVKSDLFCFESINWKLLNLTTIHLTKSMRQTDEKFKDMLFNLRFGNCTNEIFNTLLAHCKKTRDTVFTDGDIKPTLLYSNNADVNYINIMEHNAIKDKGNNSNNYKISYTKFNYSVEKYLKDNNIPESIELCINDQIMITYNIDIETGIVNGTRGIIIDVSSDNSVIVQLKNGDQEIITFQTVPIHDINDEKKQVINLNFLPIRLAFACTIHKSQGATIDFLSIDLGPSIFEFGQGYVSMSRARNLDSIIITNISKKSFKCHNKVLKFYKLYTKKIIKEESKKIYDWMIKYS